jgi:hypothetical protein
MYRACFRGFGNAPDMFSGFWECSCHVSGDSGMLLALLRGSRNAPGMVMWFRECSGHVLGISGIFTGMFLGSRHVSWVLGMFSEFWHIHGVFEMHRECFQAYLRGSRITSGKFPWFRECSRHVYGVPSKFSCFRECDGHLLGMFPGVWAGFAEFPGSLACFRGSRHVYGVLSILPGSKNTSGIFPGFRECFWYVSGFWECFKHVFGDSGMHRVYFRGLWLITWFKQFRPVSGVSGMLRTCIRGSENA